jgi:hypothetical protein
MYLTIVQSLTNVVDVARGTHLANRITYLAVLGGLPRRRRRLCDRAREARPLPLDTRAVEEGRAEQGPRTGVMMTRHGPNTSYRLFYIDADDWLTAASMSFGSDGQSVQVGTAARLFPSRIAYYGTARTHLYTVAKGGQKFLIAQTTDKGTATLRWCRIGGRDDRAKQFAAGQRSSPGHRVISRA